MNQAVLTVELPDDIYERVRRTAKAMNQPVEKALVHIVRAATPSLARVASKYRAELEAMEDLSDEQLWKVTKQRPAPAKQRRLTILLEKGEAGKLTEREHAELNAMRTAADRLMLRRSYAY